jgi:6-phosphogluconolactonase (cycloisomerase 2 family)
MSSPKSPLLLLGVLIAGCGGGGGGGGGTTTPPPATGTTFTVGGTVSDLGGTGLVLQNNGGGNLTIDADGAFTFATALVTGTAYNVTVATQPTATPARTCSVANGAGTVGSAAVTNVAVSCRAVTGKYVHVSNVGSNDVSVFAINPSTGALTQVQGSPFPVAAPTPRIIAVDPNDKFLYAFGSPTFPSGPTTIAGYAINDATGALSPIPGMAVINLPSAVGSPVTFHPNGRLLYLPVGNAPPGADNGLYAYTIDQTTGALSAVPGSPYVFPANGVPRSARISPDGQRLYVPHSNANQSPAISVFTVNTTTGELTQSRSTTLSLMANEIVLNPAGTQIHARIADSNNLIFNINATTGALESSVSGPQGYQSPAPSVLFPPTGAFVYYGMVTLTPPTMIGNPPTFGPSSVRAYSVNGTTLTELPNSPQQTSAAQVFAYTIDPTGNYLVASDTTASRVVAFTINRTTGVLTPVPSSPFTTAAPPGAVTFDRSGRFAYVTDVGTQTTPSGNTISAYSINATTGEPTLIATYPTGTGPTFFPRITGAQ